MIPALPLSYSCYEDQIRSYKWAKKCYTKWMSFIKKNSHSISNGLPSNSNSEDQKLNPWLKGQLTNMAAEASNLLLFLPGLSTSSTTESDLKKQMTSGSQGSFASWRLHVPDWNYQTPSQIHIYTVLLGLFIHLLPRADYVPGTVNKQLGREIGQRSAHLELIPRGGKNINHRNIHKIKMKIFMTI